MKMPEGWKRLANHDKIEIIKMSDTLCYPYIVHNLSSADLGEALELMKEMAEDLEKEYQRRLDTEGPYTQYVEMPESLKKFKQWR